MDLGRATWPDLERPVVVVPVGSCEQHGPHLPLHTDSVIAEALARGLVARRNDCALAPTIAITASGEHQGFPGTLSIGTEIMAGVLIELTRSADWAAGVVFVHGHGGNVTAVQRAREVADHEGRNAAHWSPALPGADPHAGHTETSIMLAVAPDEVRFADAEPGPVPPLVELVRLGVRPLSPNGVLGDPTTATAEEGRRLLDRLGDDLTAFVDAAIDRWNR